MSRPDNEINLDTQGYPSAIAVRRDLSFISDALRIGAASNNGDAEIVNRISRRYQHENIQTSETVINYGAMRTWSVFIVPDSEKGKPSVVGLVYSDRDGALCSGFFIPATGSLAFTIRGRGNFEDGCKVDKFSPTMINAIGKIVDSVRPGVNGQSSTQ